VKIAASCSQEPAVKIYGAKSPRKSRPAAILIDNLSPYTCTQQTLENNMKQSPHRAIGCLK